MRVRRCIRGGGDAKISRVINLRDFTSYFTPRRGLMSSDTWAGVATLIRNLMLAIDPARGVLQSQDHWLRQHKILDHP